MEAILIKMNARILFIDDEEELLNNYKFIYEDEYKSVDTYIGGKGAVEYALSLNPDCIICDINMPYLNGYQILVELRNAGFSKPFIFYTGHADLDQSTLKKLDYYAIINKIDIELLERTLDKIFTQ